MEKTVKKQLSPEEKAILKADELEAKIAAEAERGVSEMDVADGETPLDKNVRLMSPARMVLRRFFRSKLSITGLVIIIALFLFSWLGPVICNWSGYWGEIETDRTGSYIYEYQEIETEDGSFYQIIESYDEVNALARPSGSHLLGTDKTGKDVFVRLMYGGRISLSISIIAVFLVTIIGIVLGGLAGYFGGWVDNVVMRLCDILMCVPTMPLLLIIGTILDGANNGQGVDAQYRIYLLMTFITIFSWGGTARLVRGQILFLREQEYMVAAEAMGYSTARKLFKHLVPNILPQLIVSMTLSLGSMILYEASLSYLGMGVRAPYAAWGTMINIVSEDVNILKNYFNVWGPPGICIILAVLGFNFLGDGLRDALDPKMRR